MAIVPPQSFSRAVVDFIGNRIELLLAVDAQAGTLGPVLAHQAIHVLVGTPLPRAVRIAEVHGNAGLLAQLLVHGHLPALGLRHAQPHRLRNAQQLVREGLQDVGGTGGFELRELDQHHQSAGALDQGPHCTGIAFPLDEIFFPVPGELAIFNLWRAHMDAQHVGDLASAVLAFATRQSFVVGVAQGGDQFLAQLAHGHGIGAVVDGFV